MTDIQARSRVHLLKFASFCGKDVVFDSKGEVVRVEATEASRIFQWDCLRRNTSTLQEYYKRYPNG
jgi:hypothetical protein